MADIGSAYLTIFPSMSGFGRELTGYLGSVDLSGAGQRIGASLSRSISSQVSDIGMKGLEDAVAKAEMSVRAAMDKSADAAKELEIAQKRLSETRAKYPADSSQVAQAELRVQQAQRKSAAAAKQVDSAQGQLAHAQRELKVATESSTSALRSQDSAMDSLGGSSSGLSGSLSTVAGVAMGVAAEIAGRLFNAVAALSGEMVEAADSSQKFAQTLGFAGIDDSVIKELTASTQEYADQTVYDLSTVRNVTAQLAANGVNDYARLTEAAGNLNAVAGGNANTFQSVGMVLTQTAGAGKLMTENWNQLTDAIPGASGRLQEAMREAGAFEGNFREAMERGEISADEFFAAVQKLGMQDVAVQAATSTSTIEGALGNLQAAVVNVGAQVVTAFTPVATGIMSTLSDTIMGIPALVQSASPYFQTAFQPLTTAAQNMWTTLQPLFAQLGASIIPLIQQVSVVAQPMLQAISAYLGNMVAVSTQLWSVLAPILTQVINFVTTQLLPIVAPAIQAVANVVMATVPLIQATIANAMSVIQAIWNAVWPVLQQVAVPVLETISSVVTGVMNTIQGIISAATAAMNGDWSGAWNIMKSTVSGAISGIVSFVSGIPGRILGALGSLGSLLEGAGRDLINGLKNGIMGAIDGVVNAVKNGVESVVNAAKGLLGIASPSKVFAEIGDFTMQGLAKGIEDGEAAPVKAMRSALESAEDVFGGSEVGGTAAARAYAIGQVARAEAGGEGSAVDLLLAIASGIDEICDMLPAALDPATRARFARKAVGYGY